MRMVYCLLLLLPACTSHAVRCDGRLQPINAPAAGAALGTSSPATPDSVPPRRVP